MAVHSKRRYSAQEASLKVDVMPAPTKGMDARAPTGNMPSDVCIYTYNLMPAEYGMLIRPGYREWCIGLDQGGVTGVFSLIAFTGVDPGAVDDRLFAFTNEGIWDVTTVNAPTFELAFGVTAFGAGHGVSAHYIDQGGSDFLYYADAINGLFIYDGDTQVWAAATTEITGPNLGAVAYVMVHKQRMWLVEEGQSSAWYLPIASGLGAATEFFFGSKFPHGGRVYAMYNWSVDGGQGIDDLLVVVSSSGDVVVYQGEDPADAATWTVRGTYYIGDIPQGRRIGSEYSGDLYLISSFGLISMSDLIRGVDTNNPSEGSLSFRVARPLRTEIRTKKTELGWEPIFLPPLGLMLITIPQVASEPYLQFCLNLSTEGWGFWRGVPILSIDDWQGDVYFGTKDGRVMAMDVTLDEVLITPPPDPELNGSPIGFSLLSAYQNLGTPGLYKKVEMARPDFYGQQRPNYEQRVLYDYNFEEPPAPSGSITLDGDLWDIAEWDLAVWAAAEGFGQARLGGTSGIGRTISVALRGDTGTDLRLISWDIMWKVGGPI